MTRASVLAFREHGVLPLADIPRRARTAFPQLRNESWRYRP